MNIKKTIYLALGCIGVGLGALGAVLPLLPAFPFLLLAAFCFGKSSERRLPDFEPLPGKLQGAGCVGPPLQ